MDWSTLPLDILNCIAGKLPDPGDIIRMRVACKGWESSTPAVAGATIYRFSPWIMDANIKKILGIDFLRFYSPSSRKIYIFRLPVELQGMYPLSTDGGFVLFFDIIGGKRVELLNPLTAERIEIPPLDFETTIFFLMVPDGARQSKDIMIACTTSLYSELQIYLPNNIAWSRISTTHSPNQVVHHNGKLYFTDSEDDLSVTVFDVETLREEFTIASPPIDKYNLRYCRLVASVSHGLLLVALKRQVDDPTPFLTSSMEVYQLNSSCHPQEWVKVTSLVNHALLIGINYGLLFETTSNDTADFQGDCIYETNQRSIHKFSLETGEKQEVLPQPFVRADWFVPNTRF